MAHSADTPLGLAVSKPPVAELPYLKPAHQQLKATARYQSAKVELEPALLLELKVKTTLIRGVVRPRPSLLLFLLSHKSCDLSVCIAKVREAFGLKYTRT
jgi:hypothetical protein